MSGRSRLRIVGGTLYDPANGVDGEERDICIEDGRIAASLPDGVPTLNARGMVVMPGGVDIHARARAAITRVGSFPTSTPPTRSSPRS